MPAEIAGNQRRVFRDLFARLRPGLRSDPALPARLEALLRGNRKFGSRDRRLYRELFYTTVRHWPWVEPWFDAAPDFADAAIAWLAAPMPATRAYRAPVVAAWGDCPDTARGRAAILQEWASRRFGRLQPLPGLLPNWARAECPAAMEPAQYEALNRRAPLWIRLQSAEPAQCGAILAELADGGWRCEPDPEIPAAVRVQGDGDLTAAPPFRAGRLEIQDVGSQLVLHLAGVAPGRWLDACAGAGGKTLHLAALLGPDATVDAHDVRASALDELLRRAARAGWSHRIRRVAEPGLGAYDGVLVDAPCSGSGTWRRSPHLKWTTAPESIAASAELQVSLLAQFAAHVRPGGRLVYATCSLCTRENEEVVRRFADSRADFAPERLEPRFGARAAGSGLLVLPAERDSDGFFVASLRRGA